MKKYNDLIIYLGGVTLIAVYFYYDDYTYSLFPYAMGFIFIFLGMLKMIFGGK